MWVATNASKAARPVIRGLQIPRCTQCMTKRKIAFLTVLAVSQGQFTRFQRVFHIRPFCLLLRHQRAECLSSLQVTSSACSLSKGVA